MKRISHVVEALLLAAALIVAVGLLSGSAEAGGEGSAVSGRNCRPAIESPAMDVA